MMSLKRFFILTMVAIFVLPAVVGQSKDSDTSIEESYLQEAIELMIIRETSRSNSRDQKMIALDYIEKALERGSTNDELRVSLEYLSLEGTQNRVMEGGRQMNNFPDIRRQAAKYLGSVGTKEAKTTLIKICTTDNEPMVLQEAIKSLGTINVEENEDTINAVIWVGNRNNAVAAPDNILALAVVDALDRLAAKNKKVDSNSIQLIGRIMEGPYAPPVKERARQTLINLRRYAARS
jgi:HEAT repeat protein